MNNKQNITKVTVYTKREIIKEIAEELGIYPSAIEEVYNALEKNIVKHLMETNENTSIELKLFEGIKMQSKFIPEHYHAHPTKNYTLVPDKIKFNCKFTDFFNRQRNEEYTQSQRLLKDYLKDRAEYSKQWNKQKDKNE